MDSYKNEGFEFLQKAFNEPNILEQITGLDELHKKMEEMTIDEFDEEFDVL